MTGTVKRLRGPRLLGLLALAAATLMVVDAHSGAGDPSPVDPARGAASTVLGPFESAANGAVRPFEAVGGAFRSNHQLRRHVATLQSQNSDLRSRLASDPLDHNRLAEYDGLVRTARDTGYTLAPAHVVAIGAAQSFSRTVTLDAGTSSGIRPDSTVVSKDGLVGRVLRATRSTSTVLLVVDADSVVGGRLGATMKIGFLRGRDTIGTDARLDLELVDDAIAPRVGDAVLTWGSGPGGPYVAGIPIGQVTAVRSRPREQSQTAEVQPFVDFSALDLVGVVVPDERSATTGDRPLIHSDGSLR